MCSGFICSRNVLIFLNVVFFLVGLLIIVDGAYTNAAALYTDVTLISVIIGCGVLLTALSLVGFCGALRQHQVLLFFYMILMFLLFLIQFGLASGCLALTEEQQKAIMLRAWRLSTNKTKNLVQEDLNCCGFTDQFKPDYDTEGHPACFDAGKVICCKEANHTRDSCCTGVYVSGGNNQCPCVPCWSHESSLPQQLNTALKTFGVIVLVFSFLELLGVWLTVRYRNLKDPRTDPRAFL